MRAEYVIIGGGPTGLGAARRLAELGVRSFLVLERNPYAGGLAASFRDSRGFTWDIGGHVVFSHYEYFDRLLDEIMGSERLIHMRESWIRARGGWVPYPFQNNVRHLPRADAWECVRELMPERRPQDRPRNFQEWIASVFGNGIGELFLYPYNFKVWATPLDKMSFSWIGERVAVVDLERVLKNFILERDDVSWGPNSTFRFPERGGTGEIFRRMAAGLGDRIRYGQSVAGVDLETRELVTEQGLKVEFGALLNTAPLDIFIRRVAKGSPPALKRAASRLAHNSVYVAGVGVDGHKPDSKCWMYFPEGDCPFYRVTNFHNYSPNNVARPGGQRAFMCETSMSEHKPESRDRLMERTVQGLVNVELMQAAEKSAIASRWEYTADYGYPVPTLGRDKALSAIMPWLEERRVFSRGRFGGWKYEVGNMDHSVMQGVEWAQRMVMGEKETTYQW